MDIGNQLKSLKQDNTLEAFVVTDRKGFEVCNLGFTNVHHLHALYALGSYFFPGDHTALVVGIETVDNTVVMKQDNHGHLVAIKERNNA